MVHDAGVQRMLIIQLWCARCGEIRLHVIPRPIAEHERCPICNRRASRCHILGWGWSSSHVETAQVVNDFFLPAASDAHLGGRRGRRSGAGNDIQGAVK
jgi:hypothetical protein